MALEEIFDSFLLRDRSSNPNSPHLTVGEIVWGAALRLIGVGALAWFIIPTYWLYDYSFLVLIITWGCVVFPAYRQYQLFHVQSDKFVESSLCGSCKHFESTAQLCQLYDEHVTENHLPCEGIDWEPR